MYAHFIRGILRVMFIADTSRKVVSRQLWKSSTFDQAFVAFATTTVTHVD